MSTPQLDPHAVYFIEELSGFLRVSRRTIERARRHGTFPIPELSSLDKRPRWSGESILAYLTRQPMHRLRRSA